MKMNVCTHSGAIESSGADVAARRRAWLRSQHGVLNGNTMAHINPATKQEFDSKDCGRELFQGGLRFAPGTEEPAFEPWESHHFTHEAKR